MAYWLIKSEPFKYSWDQFIKDKKTVWDGVRNYSARLNLNAMQKGDEAFFYHSNIGVEIVGIATISKTAFQDPTTQDERWVAVEVSANKPLQRSVSLKEIKENKNLENMDLVRLGRLSVQKVTENEWREILKMANETE